MNNIEVCDGSCTNDGKPESQCESCADLEMRRELGIINEPSRIRKWKHWLIRLGLILIATPLTIILVIAGPPTAFAIWGFRELSTLDNHIFETEDDYDV